MDIEGTSLSGGSVPAWLPVVPSPSLVPGRAIAPRLNLFGVVVTPRSLFTPNIVVFDSGLGGLTVFREAVRVRPDARFVYAADDAVFPYNRLAEPAIIERVVTVMDHLIANHDPDLVVVACNTASTIVLPSLRARFSVPFVGTVPAIKPACAASATRL